MFVQFIQVALSKKIYHRMSRRVPGKSQVLWASDHQQHVHYVTIANFNIVLLHDPLEC